MIGEAEVIERLRLIATAPEARGLLDDVAVFEGLVITHDTIADTVGRRELGKRVPDGCRACLRELSACPDRR
jgi:hypothetical protein